MTPLDPPNSLTLRDEIAYVLPIGIFLTFVWLGSIWPAYYPLAYVARVILVAITLLACRKSYTRISWRYWWLGALLGFVGVVQWVVMQYWLQRHFEIFRPDPGHVFDPTQAFKSDSLRNTFIAFRWIGGATLLVPIMEELFWRDFLWRQIIAPSNFKLARIGEWSLPAVVGVSLAFGTVHANWGLTAVVWGLMIAVLLLTTRSLGACIMFHAMTNFLLGAYVLWSRDWSLW